MKRKHISFKQHEEKLLDHALQQGNFPDYVKKLIEYDMEYGVLNVKKDNRTIEEVYVEWMERNVWK